MPQLKDLIIKTELYEACLGEFKFEKLQNDFYQSNLNEIKVLLENKISNKLILKVIENFEQRQFLDKLIHAETLFKLDKKE